MAILKRVWCRLLHYPIAKGNPVRHGRGGGHVLRAVSVLSSGCDFDLEKLQKSKKMPCAQKQNLIACHLWGFV